jgi:hypothetical protein
MNDDKTYYNSSVDDKAHNKVGDEDHSSKNNNVEADPW